MEPTARFCVRYWQDEGPRYHNSLEEARREATWLRARLKDEFAKTVKIYQGTTQWTEVPI